MNSIRVTSMYGAQTRQPIVVVSDGTESGPGLELQMSSDDARAFALNLLCAAEAADQDANLVELLQEMGLDMSLVVLALKALRDTRDKREGKEKPP